MTRPTLTEQFDDICWSDEAAAMFGQLSRLNGSDEGGAVVILAAAVILAKESPGFTGPAGAALAQLTDEFADLVFNVRGRLVHALPRPVLRIIGGTDVG